MPLFGEAWLCEEGKPPAQTKWVVTGDQLRAFTAAAPAGVTLALRVARNDDRVLVAFFKDWQGHCEESMKAYIIIGKKSGTLLEMNDAAMNDISGVGKPEVEVGHCVQAER
jgi:hypothetical protein